MNNQDRSNVPFIVLRETTSAKDDPVFINGILETLGQFSGACNEIWFALGAEDGFPRKEILSEKPRRSQRFQIRAARKKLSSPFSRL